MTGDKDVMTRVISLLAANSVQGKYLMTYRVNMSPLMLGAVAGVAESLVTLAERADVRSLSRVGSQVDLQVFQSRECLVTPGIL